MKKKLSLITLLALSVQGLFAQGLLSHLNDTTTKRSLFERVANIEKKNNLFNLKLHIQAGRFQNEPTPLGSPRGHQ